MRITKACHIAEMIISGDNYKFIMKATCYHRLPMPW